MHSIFLVLRTVLSVMVARLDGKIVRALVSADGKGFIKGLGLWYLLAIPSTYTNSMVRLPARFVSFTYHTDPLTQLRHLQSKLSLHLRTRLTRYTHDLYLSSAPLIRYYRVGSEGGLEGVDQ